MFIAKKKKSIKHSPEQLSGPNSPSHYAPKMPEELKQSPVSERMPEDEEIDGEEIVNKQLDNMFENEQEERDPKLYVDVNIGSKTGMQRIVVYEGDTPDNLAK